MYNEEVKEKFMEFSSEKSKSYKTRIKNIFLLVAPYEKKYEKDIISFSEEEILNLYKELCLTGKQAISTIRTIHPVLRGYGDFCEKNNLVPVNNLKYVAYEKIDEILKLDTEVLSNKIIQDKLSMLKNASDKFVLYGLFCGIYGRNLCELSCSTMIDSNKKNGEIWLAAIENNQVNLKGRVFKANHQLFEYAEKASKEKEYIPYNNGKNIPLIGGRIVRIRDSISSYGQSENLVAEKARIYDRVNSILKYTNLSNFTAKNIHWAGVVYNMKIICSEYGFKNIEDVFSTQEYKSIQLQYNLPVRKLHVMQTLRDYL